MQSILAGDGDIRLDGLSILVVEDDYLVAQETTACLRRLGATVLGPVPDVTRSRALLQGCEPDCVLLDVNLKGHFVFDFAEELLGRGVPSIFTTGYDSSFLPPQLRSVPCLQKPIDARDLARLIREEAGSRGLASSSRMPS